MREVSLLNWSIGICLALFAARFSVEQRVPEVRWVLVVAPVVLVGWTVLVALRRFEARTQRRALSYRHLESGDYFRLFFSLFIAAPFARAHELTFWAYIIVVAVVLGGLITIACIDSIAARQVTPLALGCGLFAFMLAPVGYESLIERYGVPIIGHLFEAPQYDARYVVDATQESTGRTYRLVADIQVGGRSETDEVGENYTGQPITRTYRFRSVLIRRLHFSNGGSLAVKQYEPIEIPISFTSRLRPVRFDEETLVTDAQGDDWSVRLRNDPVP